MTGGGQGGVVLVLGAGASVSAGAPVMRDFFARARLLHRRRRLAEYESHYEEVEAARDFLRAAKIKSCLDVDNLEEVFTALETIRLIDGIPGLTAAAAERAQEALRMLTAVTLEQSIKFPVSHESGPEIHPTSDYLKLAAECCAISERVPNFPITILSFNYDIAVDFALWREKVKVSYCLDGKNCPNRVVRLCKLHGSLHWGMAKDPDRVVIPSAQWPAMDHWSLEQVAGADFACLAHTGLWQEAERRMAAVQVPFIVPPTDNKLIFHRILRPVWVQAAHALRNAELIVVIGYSLPSTDQFFRNFFALSTIGRTSIERFWVVDPSADTAARFKNLLNSEIHNKFEHKQGTFTEKMEDIAKLLGEYLGMV
jgi:hypothetical protein